MMKLYNIYIYVIFYFLPMTSTPEFEEVRALGFPQSNLKPLHLHPL